MPTTDGQMYGQMHFADYLVSYALQTLSRCLLKLGTGESLTGKDLDRFVEQISRLQSIWQMMQWSLGKGQYLAGADRLREIQRLLTLPGSHLRMAEQLLDVADERNRRVLKQLAGPSGGAPRVNEPLQRERAESILQAESSCWREQTSLRRVSDADLLEHGIGRAYGKAMGLNERLGGGGNHPPGPKRLARTQRWVAHCANHLDLLRPALPDGARARRWHLQRLKSKLEQQTELELFRRYVVGLELKGKSRERLKGLIENQRKRLEKQRRKLAAGAFEASVAEFTEDAGRAVEQLGLQKITLLPVDSAAPA